MNDTLDTKIILSAMLIMIIIIPSTASNFADAQEAAMA